jgi:hypothetical protein
MSEELGESFLLRFCGEQDKIWSMLLDALKDFAIGTTCGISDDEFIVFPLFVEVGRY